MNNITILFSILLGQCAVAQYVEHSGQSCCPMHDLSTKEANNSLPNSSKLLREQLMTTLTTTTTTKSIYLSVESATASGEQTNPDNTIKKSYDGDTSTIWHSPWGTDTTKYSGSNTFPYTLLYTLTSNQGYLQYIEITPRQEANVENGKFKEVSFYYATEENPTNFIHLMDYTFSQENGYKTKEKLTLPTPVLNPKIIKVEVKSGKNNFASLAEIAFSRECSAVLDAPVVEGIQYFETLQGKTLADFTHSLGDKAYWYSDYQTIVALPLDTPIRENVTYYLANSDGYCESPRRAVKGIARVTQQRRVAYANPHIMSGVSATSFASVSSPAVAGSRHYTYLGNPHPDFWEDNKITINSAKASTYQSGEGIEKSYDGNTSTIWHSNYKKNYTFPITVEYNISGAEALDYIKLSPRLSGANGLLDDVEVLVSTTDSPTTFTSVATADLNFVQTTHTITLPNSIKNPHTVRLSIKNGKSNFATISEIEFYKIGSEGFDTRTIFADDLLTTLKPGVTEEMIKNIKNNFYQDIAFHLFHNTYPTEFRVAEFRAWEPDNLNMTRDYMQFSYSNLDNPTGIYAYEGDELVLMVGDTNGKSVKLKVQDLRPKGNKAETFYQKTEYALTKGLNRIKLTQSGLMYFYYTETNTSIDPKTLPKIKVNFLNGYINGYFDSSKHTTADWTRLLANAKFDYFDAFGEKSHLIFETNQYRKYTLDKGLELVKLYDKMIYDEHDFMGMHKYNRPLQNRVVFFSSNWGNYYFYSHYNRTGYAAYAVGSGLLHPDNMLQSNWGQAHELGHAHQMTPMTWSGLGEVSVNIYSMAIQTKWTPSKSRLLSDGHYNGAYQTYIVNKKDHGTGGAFQMLVPFWQLQLYFAKVKGNEDFYKDLHEDIRLRIKAGKYKGFNAGQYRIDFVENLSEFTKTNLIDFFSKSGFLNAGSLSITEQMITDAKARIEAKNYPNTADPRMNYIRDDNYEKFKTKPALTQGTFSRSGDKITATGWDNVMVFEVYDASGNLIYITHYNQFTIPTGNASVTIKAVSYDGNDITINGI